MAAGVTNMRKIARPSATDTTVPDNCDATRFPQNDPHVAVIILRCSPKHKSQEVQLKGSPPPTSCCILLHFCRRATIARVCSRSGSGSTTAVTVATSSAPAAPLTAARSRTSGTCSRFACVRNASVWCAAASPTTKRRRPEGEWGLGGGLRIAGRGRGREGAVRLWKGMQTATGPG